MSLKHNSVVSRKILNRSNLFSFSSYKRMLADTVLIMFFSAEIKIFNSEDVYDKLKIIQVITSNLSQRG
jgi:hypothetical protein